MATRFRINRRLTGAAGAPSALKSAELAYNMMDKKLYVGFGDDGSGNATSIKAFAADDFVANLPSGWSNGKFLGVSSGNLSWVDPPQTLTPGTGLTLTGSTLGFDDAILVTHSDLSAALADMASDSELASAIAGKADAVHVHAASDVTSGTFDAARIPALDASKIGSGTLDAARLPASVFQAPVVASTNIASLTSPQQTDIRAGSTVVTSDGRFWIYRTGSKTAEASYQEMADRTPEWTQVANKPTFASVATSGSYTDLTNKPTISTAGASGSYTDLTNKPSLGTMAAQAASAVAITGGTIDGVILDGGTF